jgi:hypothetical protein
MARLMVALAAAALMFSLSALTAAQAPAAGATTPTATQPARDTSPLPPSISPPVGAQVLYVADEADNSSTIHLYTADGSLDSIVAPGTLPGWAPDGQRFVYTCKPERTDYIGSLCIHDPCSASDTVIVANGTLASWSPSAELIAFTRDIWGLGDAWIYQAEPRKT